MTEGERDQIAAIEQALRKRRLSFDDRLNLADELGMIARPIVVVKPAKPEER